uniref:Coenzyme Q-binding protein COQ10 START domain-containing protein n=2 Tax=Parascaris univalens TaxID=6257 RepID=A0A915BML5_PARUN
MLVRSVSALSRRHLFSPPPFTLPLSRRKEYEEKRLVGFSFTAEEMFEVVARVSEYPQFVPWCRDAHVKILSPSVSIADLQIGFPPLLETYSSRITTSKPTVVRSVCIDQRLFNLLDTTWRFGAGDPSNIRSCTLHFMLAFEFKSLLHSQLAHVFFDQVVRTMVTAFLKRAEIKYGPPSLDHFKTTTIIKKVS